MKKIVFSVLAAFSAAFTVPAYAADIMVASTMQRCTTNEECALVTNSCQDNCAYVPINRANLPALETLYQSRCNKAMSANPACNMNPPISAACINARCTIDYAYANNAGAKDYQSGAYPVPAAPVPSKVPAGAYANVNDRNGHFTAYDLPKNEVRQDTVGQIVDKIYVPPSAPVSGGNYVPVTGAVPSAPATPPQAAPGPAPVTAPATPAYAPQTNAAAPATQPAAIPPAAVPTNRSYATPPSAVPAMTPSKPNQLPPGAYPAPTPASAAAPLPTAPVTQPETYVPAPTQPTIPAPGLPPAPAAKSPATKPAVPSVGAPGVPQAPAGSVPIPPSDLKPAPTFVPPPGTPVPAGPEDPGAPPPAGTTMLMPLPNGGTAVIGGAAKVETKKTFATAKPKKENYN
jgi:hypothetical protein